LYSTKRRKFLMKAIAMLSAILILTVAAVCFAGETPGYINDNRATTVNANVKMALHILPHGVSTCSGKSIPVITSFDGIIRTQSTHAELDVFLVIFDYDSLSGYEYDLNWPAEWGSASTQVCVGDLGVGQIIYPSDPGLAYTLSGGTCKISGVNAAAFLPVAYSWLAPNSDGEIEIEENKNDGNNGVLNCPAVGDPAEQWIQAIYNAGVNVDPYEGPGPATVPTSWGSIKALFR
jgi:hypothetical protein